MILSAIETEGLLRMTGKFDNIEALIGPCRLTLTSGKASLKSYDSIQLASYNVHDVAAVLRVFFREMPEPVIPFEMYEPLMEVQRNVDLPIDSRVRAIKDIILGLSPSNAALLRFLVKFLQDIEEHSNVNKMTVS